MKVFMKVTAGLALATLVIGQPALAASPRAMNAQATSSSTDKVAGVRASKKVARKNGADSNLLLAGLGGLAAAGGLYLLIDGNNNDEPASP